MVIPVGHTINNNTANVGIATQTSPPPTKNTAKKLAWHSPFVFSLAS